VVIDNAIQPQPVVAELPTADNVIEILPNEVGGEVPAVPELSRVEPQVEVNYPTETPDSPPIPQGDAIPPTTTDITPIEPLQPEGLTTVEHVEMAQWSVPKQPVDRVEWNAPGTPPSTKRVIEFFRTGEGAFVASTPTVRRGAPLIHSIEEVIKRHRIEMTRNNTCNISVKEALKSMGEEARKVIVQELKQMLDKSVWVPVMGSRLTAAERAAVIRSSMFLKKKNNPDGSFQKLKARLVAGGDQQDKDLYENLSSPTVSTSSVFTMIGVSAHEGRHVAVLDVSGAFLNAEMTLWVPVHMKLDRTMSEFIAEIDWSYSKYVDAGGVHHSAAEEGSVWVR
jgi:Reverse transcriptase (RNA-dependent DNA polymerase)